MNKILKAIVAGSACLLSVFSLVGCAEKKQPVPDYATGGAVEVSGGKISGLLNESKDVAIYKGVPYAASPVGALRFCAPQDVTPWDGVKDCSLWGANAMQGDASVFSYWTKEFIQDTDPSHYQNGVVYSEDCLTLNIWSSTAVTKDKPVLVYIHGGGYNTGGASCPVYDGEYMAEQGVVFVSVQYRVGVLGYLATDALTKEADGAGNYGLLDQIKALEWVNENIENFGGDPDNVTIMGQSAGAGSVNALLCSPLAEGLFAKAVSASHNSIHQDWQTVSQRVDAAPSGLKNKSADELRQMNAESFLSYSIANNGPVLDGTVLKKTYRESILDRSLADVPLMSGMVAEDHLISSVYTSDGVSVVDSLMTLQSYISKARKNAGYSSPFYAYLFNRDVPQDDLKTPSAYGAKHSYDLAYFFGNFVDNRGWTESDRTLSKNMSAYLVNFCLNDDPNGKNLPEWSEQEGYSYFLLDETCSSVSVPLSSVQAVTNHYKLDLSVARA